MKKASTTDLYQYYLQSSGISIDSRSVKEGEIFFALKGPNFDGHKYIPSAIASGASLAVVDDQNYHKDGKTILVDNVETALQNLAKYHRLHLTIPVVGLTGSNGKTTTKELTYAALSTKYKVYATAGNLNNHLGVPLSILRITNQHEIAIIEMGANHPLEIKFLCEIAMPEYGLITNIGEAHLEGFGDLEGVRKSKTELYDYLLATGGTIFYNTEDDYLQRSIVPNHKIVSYSPDELQVWSSFPSLQVAIGDLELNSLLTGRYNALNIIAAVTLARYFNVNSTDIKKGIESYNPQNNRSQIMKTKNNTLILDAYNANPSSMKASIENLASADVKNKVLIIGHMLEVGALSQAAHLDLVNYIAKNEWKKVFLVGSEFQNIDILQYENLAIFTYCQSTDELAEELRNTSIRDSYILMKGSRGIALEQVVEFL